MLTIGDWLTPYLVDDPTERTGSISTREDILVHEQTPSGGVSGWAKVGQK
jgi:hypothetical protein